MRLRLIYRGDFRKSEETLYNEVLKKHTGLKLGPEDCILLMSGSGKILKFVFGFTDQDVYSDRKEDFTGNKTKILESIVYRISGAGGWNPTMLANYAEQVGVPLVGLRKFQDYYKTLSSR